MSDPQKEGQCDRCRTCWTWTIRVKLKDQICLTCNQPLKRVTQAGRDKALPGGAYTWLGWESYQPARRAA